MTGILMALGGSFAVSGLLVATLVVAVHGFVAGQPLHGGDWIAVAILGGLSAIFVAVVVRAWRAARRRGQGMTLTTLALGLLVAGAAVGGYVGYLLSADRVSWLDTRDKNDCRRVLGADVEAERLAACLPLAQRCRWKHAGSKVGSGPEQLARLERIPKHIRPPMSPRGVQELLCVIDALGQR